MTIYLVRHGSAGSRDEDDPDDLERRLDEVGRQQAKLLAEVMDGRPVDEIRSSPAPRCLESVEPLAQELGLVVVTDDALLEGTDVDRAWKVVERLAATGRDAVLCSHGDVIPDLVHRAQQRGMQIPGKSGCSKGSLWALHWANDAFVSGDYTTIKV